MKILFYIYQNLCKVLFGQEDKNNKYKCLIFIYCFIFLLISTDVLAQENLIPNGDFESGGTPSCIYQEEQDYEISDWIRDIVTFDWYDWNWRTANGCVTNAFMENRPTTILSKRCVGFFAGHGGDVCESMKVRLKQKLVGGRSYKFKIKCCQKNESNIQVPFTNDLKLVLRFATSEDWCHSPYSVPNGNPNNNVKLSVTITIDKTKKEQWIDLETYISVPIEYDNMLDYLIIHGDASNNEGYFYFDDAVLYSSCESSCAQANISDPIEFVPGAAPWDNNVCKVNGGMCPDGNYRYPWYFKVKNATEIWFTVFNESGNEYFYAHEKNPLGLELIEPGYDHYQFMWNGYSNNRNVVLSVFSYNLRIANCNDYIYYQGAADANNAITVIPGDQPPIIIPYFYTDAFIDNCCAPNADYQNIQFTGTFRKDVEDFIIAGENVTTGPTGPVIVNNNANVTFNAGNYITLMPGFSVENGAKFHANCKDCQ